VCGDGSTPERFDPNQNVCGNFYRTTRRRSGLPQPSLTKSSSGTHCFRNTSRYTVGSERSRLGRRDDHCWGRLSSQLRTLECGPHTRSSEPERLLASLRSCSVTATLAGVLQLNLAECSLLSQREHGCSVRLLLTGGLVKVRCHADISLYSRILGAAAVGLISKSRVLRRVWSSCRGY
jgi:hypothetical protein